MDNFEMKPIDVIRIGFYFGIGMWLATQVPQTLQFAIYYLKYTVFNG